MISPTFGSAYDKSFEAFLDRVVPYIDQGMELQEAMQAVLEDDKRIISEMLRMPREHKRELANLLAESVYASCRS